MPVIAARARSEPLARRTFLRPGTVAGLMPPSSLRATAAARLVRRQEVQSILPAGAGVRGASEYDSSDRTGGYPADLVATFPHQPGVPDDTGVDDRAGRPYRACYGMPGRGLIG